MRELAVDLEIGEDVFVGAVHVVHVVRRVLVMADQLACRRPDRQHAGRVKAVHLLAGPRIVRLRVAHAPVDEIELRIVGARSPRRPAAHFPGVAVFRPRLRPGLAGRGNRVPSPQLLAGLRIPAVQEPARRGFAAGHAGNHDALGDDWRAGGVVPLAPVGELLFPDLFPGLHVECDDVVVDRHAVQLAVVDRRGAARDRVGALHLGIDLHWRAPDLAAGFDVDGKRPLAVDHVHDAVVDRRRRQLAGLVHQARAPDRHQLFDVAPVDLLERAVALPVVAHALGGDVVGILPVADQFLGRLGGSDR